MAQALSEIPSFEPSDAQRAAHRALMTTIAHPSLSDRRARLYAGRTEVLFSTRSGRFCFQAVPDVKAEFGAEGWLFGILYVFDGTDEYKSAAWRIIKGSWTTSAFHDDVWVGPADDLGAEAIQASSDYRFRLASHQRPTPPLAHLP